MSTYVSPYGTHPIINIQDNTVTEREEYLELAYFDASQLGVSGDESYSQSYTLNNYELQNNRLALYLRNEQYTFVIESTAVNVSWRNQYGRTRTYCPGEYQNPSAGYTSETTISTNIPIFLTLLEANAYINAVTEADKVEALSKAVNYGGTETVVDDTTREYYIYNRYQQVSISRGIITTEDVDVYHWLAERILYNGTDICLYRYDSSNPFKLKIKCGQGLIGSIFSNIGSGEVQDADYSQFTLDTLLYDSPFYSDYKIKYTDASGETEIETPDYQGYLGTLRTNIPIFNTEDDVDDFLAGTLDVTEADNYNRISQDPTWQEVVTNTTGVVEEETEFGEVFVRNIFSQVYLCNTAALYEISNNLFDYTPDATIQGQWEKIKKGLEMYGSNPMDAVQGLRFYPFDLSQIFTNVQSQNYVYFGAYKQDLNTNVYKLIYANGYKDLGSIRIKRTYKDWRDFEPYTRLSVYLPYIGRFPLDLQKYYDKNVNIRYYIDIRTGACDACLIADGVLLDWFDGIIGTEMPITLSDYASYAQSQLQIMSRNLGISSGGGAYMVNRGTKINKQYSSLQKDLALKAEERFNAGYVSSANQQLSATGTVNLSQAGAAASKASAATSAAASKAGLAAGAGIAGAAVGAAGVAAIVGMKTAFELTNNGIGGYNNTKGSSSAMINQFLPQYPTFMFEIQEIDESEYLNELYGRPTNASGRLGDFSGYLEAEDIMLICPTATDDERQEIINLVRSGIYI